MSTKSINLNKTANEVLKSIIDDLKLKSSEFNDSIQNLPHDDMRMVSPDRKERADATEKEHLNITTLKNQINEILSLIQTLESFIKTKSKNSLFLLKESKKKKFKCIVIKLPIHLKVQIKINHVLKEMPVLIATHNSPLGQNLTGKKVGDVIEHKMQNYSEFTVAAAA